MADPFEGMDPLLAARVKALIAASGGRITLVSGYRSPERQAELYEQGKRKHGKNVNKWVAPPGKSNHNKGLAADLHIAPHMERWVKENMTRFGLWQPMNHEPWHLEAIRTATEFDPEAYTEPPLGGQRAGDPNDPYFQFTQMLGTLDAEMQADFTTARTGGIDLTEAPDALVDLDAGGAGGQGLDDGARMVDYGLRDEPDEMEARLDEMIEDS